MKVIKKTPIISIIIILLLASFLFLTPLGRQTAIAGGNLIENFHIFQDVINIINTNYVDTPDWNKVFESATKGIMNELDPHSVFIEKKELADINESFKGKFEGIGIEFDVLEGYITVIAPVADSPSDHVGLQPGDKIVKIDGESAYKITQDDVRNKLRGPKGSKVTVTIRRYGTDDFDVDIIRDEIPLYSVSAAVMLDDKTGYIYLNRFSGTTADEIENALTKLENEGMEQLIFDLRSNGGGFLDQAVKVADKFIDGRKKIVYTKGRIHNSNEEFYSGQDEGHKPVPLVVVIDRGSASASEIISGAIQDLDRGVVVGETSFGKGLVQRQYQLRDGSAIRVTVAKYYTPSGRLIQRPYEEGNLDKYYETFGEKNRDSLLAVIDSNKVRPEFKTASGRTVFGGGGITPDYYVPWEQKLTKSTIQVMRHSSRVIFEYCHQFISNNQKLGKNKEKFINSYELKDSDFDDFVKLVEEKEINFNREELETDKAYLKYTIKSEMAKEFWGYDEFYKIRVLHDNQILEAMKYFNEAGKMLAES